MTELRQRLGSLVNRAAYGGERVILVSHGEPKAAIIGVEDLRHLQQLDDDLITQVDRTSSTLATADFLRERIRQWQETHNVEAEDSVETLTRLRAGRDDELTGLR
jgi:prevent-host-death family protein